MHLSIKLVIIFLIIGICALIIELIIGSLSSSTPKKDECKYCPNSSSKLGELCSDSPGKSFQQYAVSTDSNVCADAGKTILDEDGNAVDAIIAVLLCMGVTIPESMGLGGGSMIVIYNQTTNQSVFINAREMAPEKAFRDMYNSTNSLRKESSLGVRSIAVPGELAGYWHMFKNYGSGKITWERLFKDAINFAMNGFSVGKHFHDTLQIKKNSILKYQSLHQIYINPDTNDVYKANEIFKQPKLAETLMNISKASDAHEYFYNKIAEQIINDINNHNDFPELKPILQLSDFQQYKVIEEQAYQTPLKDNIILHTNKLPGSGILLSFILKVMLHEKFQQMFKSAKTDTEQAILFYHRLMETFKFAYAKRMHLGDDRFDNCTDIINELTSEQFIDFVVNKINDSSTFPSKSKFYDVQQFQELDHGTAHVSVLDKNGNGAAASTTINLYFGSKVMSPSTGILLNDEMDDFNTGNVNAFDLPPAFANTVKGFKRPLSSMSPAVFVDETGPRLIIGASGGSKITTAVALVSLRHLWMNDDIKLAIDSSRLHHQLFPDFAENEQCFPQEIVDGLRKRKHTVQTIDKNVRGAVVMGISRSKEGIIRANSDFRKGGSIAGV